MPEVASDEAETVINPEEIATITTQLTTLAARLEDLNTGSFFEPQYIPTYTDIGTAQHEHISR